MLWWILYAALLLICIISVIYLTADVYSFGIIRKISQKNKIAAWILSVAAVVFYGGIWLIYTDWAAFVVYAHWISFRIVSAFISAIISGISHKKPSKNYAGEITVVFTTVYLGIGFFMAHNIVPTYYSVETHKDISEENLRIALIADCHLSMFLDGDEFADEMEHISAENPDIMIVAGDFVDDDSCRADMVKACKALGEIDAEQGIYFVWGNHDKGYVPEKRDFSEQDLRDELTENGVIILEDDTIMLRDNVFLTGRRDKQDSERLHFSKLTKGYEAYDIVIDHQPDSYREECEWGADLVLSGHTHGGHVFPVGFVQDLFNANENIYGLKQREILGNHTDFIVTSGLSGWAIPFKTFPKSEYVIIDLKHK